jgi:hypothetical protein
MALYLEAPGAALNRAFISRVRPDFPGCINFLDFSGGDLAKVTKNLTRAGPDGVIVGTPSVEAEGVTFTAGSSWLDTQQFFPAQFSAYAVVKRPTAPTGGAATPRAVVFSNYGTDSNGGTARDSLTLEGSDSVATPGGAIGRYIRFLPPAAAENTSTRLIPHPTSLAAWMLLGYIVAPGMTLTVRDFTNGLTDSVPLAGTHVTNNLLSILLGSGRGLGSAEIAINKFVLCDVAHDADDQARAYATIQKQAAFSGVTV